MPIPKIIWQSWKTKDLPSPILKNINKILHLNPNYIYRLLTDEEIDNFVHVEYSDRPEVVSCYDRLNIIVAKVDFWRYLVLYKYGGIYLDMDSDITGRLDDLILDTDDAIISSEGNPGIFVQWALIFSPGHPILKNVIDLIVENIQNNSFPNDILHMTGPRVFTRAVNMYHKELYNVILYEQNKLFDKNIDITFRGRCNNSKYRIFGIDYNEYFSFFFNDCHLLFDNVIKWTDELKIKNLLKDI